ncbi:MAG: hypothetical protein DI598_14060 [Pseudopedobacter saltans]|uniref:Uncharacterized protein n=1 Tax=Pseudopedobacter saltans TaxID=151895 RepID=A0A2W5ESF9_9SPHI|nr:MAG: hypothetical protein DI598_14060 [Pseudopedobacter saltans]
MANAEKKQGDVPVVELDSDHPVIGIMAGLEKMSSEKQRKRFAWLTWTVERMEARISELESRLGNRLI